jgi:hypothetical protein|nr:MAG TPA: hypothetical protein [Caudoviricetes sp.]
MKLKKIKKALASKPKEKQVKILTWLQKEIARNEEKPANGSGTIL